MIPKVLHYVWLGGNQLPALEKKCLQSWITTNPDYEIKLWNEQNLDIQDPIYLSAYSKKEWAYCSDYARLKVIYELGGIYLDTDMELIKSLDDLLNEDCFIGKENDRAINAAIFGAVKNNKFVGDCFESLKKSLKRDFVPIPRILTSVYELGNYEKINILPKECFYPYNPHENEIKNLLFSDIKNNTYGIHHWKYSWKPKFRNRVIRKIKRILTRSEYFYKK